MTQREKEKMDAWWKSISLAVTRRDVYPPLRDATPQEKAELLMGSTRRKKR